MKKSIVFILLTSLFTGAFSACQPTDAMTSAPQSSESAPVSPEPSEPAPTAEETPTPASTEEASSDPSSSPDESEALSETDSFSVNTENSLLFHEKGVTILASPWDSELSALPVQLENTSEQNYILQLTDTSVNGSMIESSFSQNLDAHSQTNAQIEFSSQLLSENGIQSVYQIQTRILLLDAVTFETLYTSNLLTITLNGSAPSKTAPQDGETIYEQDGLKILSLGLEEDPTWGKSWKVSVTNNSQKDLVVAASSAIVNDSTLDVIFSVKVPAGKSAVGSMTLFQNDLDKYQIQNITDLEVSLDFQDPSTYQTIQTTDPLFVHFSS